MPSFSPNRLAREKSPYLLQHAHNPVDWYPWGDEAFARARHEQKPIFLSIGYSTCHWCHVMEHESFESSAIAAFLAENFISIKVDREERPDVDQVYMAFVQATTGHGGWPMSVWLTPELKPFYGGTYFPPTDMPGRPGFITVLRRIAELWKTDRNQIEDKAHSLLTALREAESATAKGDANEPWSSQHALQIGLGQYTRMFDTEQGGFGSAPKFPRPVNLEFLLFLAAEAAPHEAGTAEGMAFHTLRRMAAGGLHDHLGGGFHRYSVDADWHVPHFEKMLYDQAQLAPAFLAAHQLTADPAFAATAAHTLHYVQHDLTSPSGGFYSAEDADSLPRSDSKKKLEGAFYVWTDAVIREVLGEQREKEFRAVYGVEPDGNVSPASDPHGELNGVNVLIQRLTIAEAAQQFAQPLDYLTQRLHDDRAVLLSKRGLRPRPHLDDKIITAWNGLMIAAFARGAQVLANDSFLHSAQKAAAFLRDHLYDPGTNQLKRSYREGPSHIPGFAVDYAFLIHGLLDLYAADFDLAWLNWARQLQDALDLHFWDQLNGGYYSTSDSDPAILLRMKEDYEGAEPAPTSVSVWNLWRMGHLYHNPVLLDHARHAVQSFSQRLETQPFAMPLLLAGAALLEKSPIHLIIHATSPGQPGLKEMLKEARRHYQPRLLILRIATDEERAYFAPRHPTIESLPKEPPVPTAYLCEDYTCRLPITDPAELSRALSQL